MPEENAPIWDENNKLVNAEMDTHFKEASAVVLETEEGGLIEIDLDAPKEYQALEGQTKDVQTSPYPSSDPNSMPTEFTTNEEVAPAKVSGAPDSGGTAPPATPPATPPSTPPPVEGGT